MFNSAMIAGISAIIDPRGPDGHPMRYATRQYVVCMCIDDVRCLSRILTTFLEQNPWHQVRTKDQTTRKEVQIVSAVCDASHEEKSHADLGPYSVTPGCADLREFVRSR